MKNKLVCSMLVVAMCFGQLVSANATTVSDNDVEISTEAEETAEEVQEVEEVAAETAVPNIQGVADEIRTHKVDTYSFDFLGTKDTAMTVAIYKAGDFKAGGDSVVQKMAIFDAAGKATITLDTAVIKAGDYEVVYYYADDKASANIIPFYVRKSIDVKNNAKITKVEVAKAVYTGSDVEPVVTIEENDGKAYTLVKDKDFTVKVISDNKKEYGVAKVKITGIGDFTGEIEQEFDIVPTMPTVSSVECTGYKSAKVTWTKVAGVDGYDIERKTGDGKFEVIGSVTGEGTLSYEDKATEKNNLITGQTYAYRVRATKRTGADKSHEVSSDASETGISVTILPAMPKNLKAESTASNKLKLTWDKVDGASGYAVYQIMSNGSLKRIKYVTANTYTVTKDKATGKNLVCGSTYRYTVKAYLKNPETGAKIFSKEDTVGITAKAKPATPKLVSAKTDGYNKVTIKWKKVAGAYGYYVYRKEANNEDASWKKIKTVKFEDTTSYVDAKATTGITYVYSVKAYTKVNGKKVSGDMNQTGKKATPLPGKTALKLSMTPNGTGIVVRIANAQGADGYYIYRKQNNGSFKNYARIDAQKGDITTYTDSSIAAASTFEYYVVPFVEGESKRIKGTKSEKVKIYVK